MALVKHGPLVSMIRGSAAGVTFTRSRAGATIRAKRFQRRTPASRAPFAQLAITANQTHRRAQLSVLSDRWATTLTQTQRDDWDLLATRTQLINKLGERHFSSGRLLYIRSNSLAVMTALGLTDTAPAVAVAQMPETAIVWDAINSWFTIRMFRAALPPSARVIIWNSPHRPTSRNVHTYPYYFHSAPNTPAVALALTTPAQEAAWRTCCVYFFRLRVVNADRAVSHPLIIRALAS